MIKLSSALGVIGLGVLIAFMWNAVSEPVQPQWKPTPTPPSVIWCTPVAVPLYTNGTDCQ